MNPEAVANDLTQLSSREQLSALMDGALPADQTRFLLRRLQHDAPLAECWQRWRLAGEVMPPEAFAGRVGVVVPQHQRSENPVWAYGRFYTAASLAGTHERALAVADFLIQKSRQKA